MSSSTFPIGNNGDALFGNALKSSFNARISLVSGAATNDSTSGATTLYLVPFTGNWMGLYNGSTWDVLEIVEDSIAVPATTATLYDVFVYNNSGVATMELLVWSSSGAGTSARATALTTQDGIYVKTGDATRRYAGTVRTGSVSGQLTNSSTGRDVWNYYNRVDMHIRDLFNASWTYATLSTWRACNAGTGTELMPVVMGVKEGAGSVHSFTLRIPTSSNTSDAHQLLGLLLNGADPDEATQSGTIGKNTAKAVTSTVAPIIAAVEGFNTLQAAEYIDAGATTVTYTRKLGVLTVARIVALVNG